MTNSRPAAPSNRQKTVAKPRAIIVLGMHRSGTSALTRVLNLLGCALPSDLIEPNNSNALGHWESADAVALNDRILASAGSKWDDWGPINADFRKSSARDEMAAEVAGLLADHTKLGSLFALKDPRLCRIVDVWLDAMQDAKVTPLIAMIIRNPAEVALSLESRDLMSQGYGQLLWLRHVLDAEHLSRGQRRVVVTYDQLLGNWFEVADRIKTGLDVAFPRNSPSVHMEIENFLSPMHRHHQEPADKIFKNPGLSEWLRKTLAILLSWSEKGESESDYAELDRIRQEFDRSYTAFARLLIQDKAAGEVGSGLQLKQKLTSQIAEAQQASALAQASIKEAEEKLAAQATQSSQLQAELDRMQHLEAELEVLRKESEKLQLVQTEAQNLRAAEEELASQVAQLEAALAASSAEAAKLNSEIARLQSETQTLVEVQAALAAATSHAEDLETEVARLMAETETLDTLRTDAEALRQRAAELESEAASLQEALGRADESTLAEKKRRLEAEALLQKLTADLEQQKWKADEYKSQAATTKSAMIQREEELAQLWKQLLEAEKTAAVAQTRSDQEVAKREAAEQAMSDLRKQAELAAEEQSLAAERLAAEIAMTTRLLRDENMAATNAQSALTKAENELKSRERECKEALQKLQRAEKEIEATQSARVAAERKLTSRFDEIARLTAMLNSEAAETGSLRENADWLREVAAVSRSFPKWWVLLPSKWRRKKEHARYRRRGLFDAEQYLANNPDVVSEKIDPILHFILHGSQEGRTWRA